MEIQQIKQQLEIIQVATSLGIQVGKGDKAICPFHNDKSPSLQFSKEKQIATCFSSNCNLGTVDVIGLTEKKLQKTTHETLKYLSVLAEEQPTETIQTKVSHQENHSEIRSQIFNYFRNGFMMRKDNKGKAYLQSRNLNVAKLENLGIVFGYNSAQFHHRGRITNEEMQACEQAGLLIKSNSPSKTATSYSPWASHCVIFPLTDEQGNITGLYGRSVNTNPKQKTAKHFYLRNSKGLFYKPKQDAKKLIITESIIDFLTLYQIDEIRNNYDFLPIYGTNRLTEEHNETLNQLKNVEEIVFFFDGDKAGREANKKYAKQFKAKYPALKISSVATPENEDINSLLDGHTSEIFTQLLNERVEFFLSIEKEKATAEKPKQIDLEEMIKEVESESKKPAEALRLNTSNPNKIIYSSKTAAYYIKGGIRKDLDSLKVSLVIEHLENKGKSRNKLDLYEDKQTEKIARESAEKLNLRADLIEQDLNILTDLLDQHREENTNQTDEESKKVTLPKETESKCLDFLKSQNLLSEINDLIGKSGVVGEEKNRLFLFGIASTYKMENTLHALIQGTSGSGKTHLLATIMDFMPPEDTINLTRVTESSFYNYGEYELSNKLIGMEDFDGLEEKAELAFRELMSKGMISSSTSGKNEHTGQIAAYIKTVYGPIASLSATTKGEIYEDNMSRCFLISVDESVGQTANIIKYQNNKAAGQIDRKEEKEIREFLRNCMRLLQSLDVVNPFANKIDLPKEAHKIRRLNDLFQSYVKQITLLNQYQRKKDAQGRLITDKEDLRTAIEIMFDSIILKVDELDGSLRDFYEKLKSYVLAKGKEYEFEQREIRQQFRISKTQMHRNINNLIELEYITKTYVSTRNTFHYKIAYWDNMEALRNRIKQDLNNQLDKL